MKILNIKPYKNIYLIPFKALEKNKSRKKKEELEDYILIQGITRKDAVVAIGGGITIDLAGFIASTILRGVCLYSVPTTLMAMVDAAIGGKNGINTPFGKNLIGSFYLSKKIWIDVQFLCSLSPIDLLNGLSEIIKYAIVADLSLLDNMNSFSESLIKRCIEIKKFITEKDFLENDLRLLLNFGHTIGHALEFASSYKIPHGIAVFYGMIIEASFSKEFSSYLPTLSSLQKKFDYPKIYSRQINWENFKASLNFDKKRTSDKIPIVIHSPLTNTQDKSIIGEFSLNEILEKTRELFSLGDQKK